jgi:hypothetical protein
MSPDNFAHDRQAKAAATRRRLSLAEAVEQLVPVSQWQFAALIRYLDCHLGSAIIALTQQSSDPDCSLPVNNGILQQVP